MLEYSVLSNENIKQILKPYGIKNFNTVKKLSGGSENTNYLITTKNNRYVLCLFEHKSLSHAHNLTKLLSHLKIHKFKTTETFPATNGEILTIWNKKPILIKHFIEGKIKYNLSNHLIELVGKALGKLHQIPPPSYLPKIIDYGQEHFGLVSQYAKESPFEYWIKEIKKYIKPYLKKNLPKALIHSDLFCDNVIISQDKQDVTIIDFEEAAYYFRVFDLGMAIIGSCSEKDLLNKDKIKSLLHGYSKVITLMPEEKRSLQAFTVYAGASMSFWRHKNFNYVYPNMGMENHYKALQTLADHARKNSNLFID